MLKGFCEMKVKEKDKFFGSWAPAPPRVKPWRSPRYCQAATVTRTKACDPSATASALPLGRPPPAETPPGYAAATDPLTPRARLDATAHRRQDTDAPGRPAACQGQAPPACGAGALAAARGPAAVRITQLPKHYYA